VLEIANFVADGEIVFEQIAELAHCPGHRDDFRGEAHLGFDLPSLEAIDADVRFADFVRPRCGRRVGDGVRARFGEDHGMGSADDSASRETPKRRLEMRPVRRPYAHVVEAARRLLEPLGIREPRDVDVAAIAHAAGAEYVVPSAKLRGEGHTLRARGGGGRALVAIADTIWGTRHGRFVAAHEVGHLWMHAEQDVLPVFMGSATRLAPGARKIEAEATDAGCEILMPEAWFAGACRGAAPGMRELRAMADRFEVDLAAAALRALLYVEEPCAVVVAKGGVVDWVACSEGWDLYLRRKRPLPEGSAAATVARGGTCAEGGMVCAARVWGERPREEGADGDIDESAAASGEVREYVAKESDLVIAWLVRTGLDVRA
jgi:IrrE N-terminal-like domain